MRRSAGRTCRRIKRFNRVVYGKVEEHWVKLDLFGLMQQLGAIPEPEHSEEASPT